MSRSDAALARLAERRPKLIDLGLGRMENALARLDHPERRLPPVVHVAGTNGKGSTCAFIAAALRASGRSVHAYTSPHLVRFNERIVLADNEISDDQLADVLLRCEEAAGEETLTYFEAVTSAAFLAFAETPADVLVLEVGLGGRLDATNVAPTAAAAVVAPVGMDHQEYLGTTLGEIAREKAGVFRRGAPAVIGRQGAEAADMLSAEAARIGARPYRYGEEWRVYEEHGRLVFEDEESVRDLSAPRLLGRHQIDNAGLAVAALVAGGFGLDDAALSKGLETACWPARMQRLKSGPLVDRAAELTRGEAELWLDGGHNPHAAQAVSGAFADLHDKAPRPLVLIAGMQSNKDPIGYFEAFAGLAAAAFTVEAGTGTPYSPEDLAAAATRSGVPARPCGSVMDALERACRGADAPPRILICGSLYLAGEVLRDNA
ncbi:MAG: folylpolyglutamate synthase/dihydrofolate synthase family protein [Pseudomonadota bacterium]